MSKPHYRYNPKTLRYERIEFSVWRFLGSFISYLAFASFFFVTLNLLQNSLIETDLEKSLRQENNALVVYKASLIGQLNDSKSQLKDLQQKEAGLYQELFEATPEKSREETLSLPHPTDTEAQLDYLQHWAQLTKNKSQKNNDLLSQYLNIDKSDLPLLFNLPSGQPIANITPDNLISGFGIRINPFHKAKYHHDGVDLSFTKGTDVVATGNGKVLNFSYSAISEGGLGNYIDIDHGNGIISRYAHLHDVNVSWGQKIKKGQKIGTVGSTGASAAPHLHYEIIKDGKPVNPMVYMVEAVSAEAHDQLTVKSKKLNQSLD
ncbi:MAG: M23 family metallopeptidase [Cytophagales bacterium]|jgi:murein DD-endopeptidase MepM/ murein hydrolase activator NlpD|nr:M23 family metallopeptidase [Bacteroidota bacterium]MBS1982015.1 M23 family metallopeptidase [Bacteroidota bacterium]WHZ09469.1 MAG: M23 family metallopeptidase [Cytophagales bacterium]